MFILSAFAPLGRAQRTIEPQPQPEPVATKADLADLPPGVEAATLQLLDTRGTALLEVTFEKDDRLGTTVPLVLGGKEQILRDDGEKNDAKAGDGVFSAVIDFDLKTLQTQAEFAIKSGGRIEPQAVFRGREVVGVEDQEAVSARLKTLVELQDVNRLVESRARINLFNFVPLINPATINPANSLMITNTTVIQDPTRTINPCTGVGNPNGVWTFKHLVTEMVAGTGINPSDFVEQWLRLWLVPQTPNAFTAPARAAILAKILNPWPRIAGKLDLDRSPFRLSAIVNRADLGNNPTYGGGSAGEGRFVFGVLDRTLGGCNFMPFSVIFEYGIPVSGCEAIKDWANQWIDLSFLPIGSLAYRAALEAITEQFVKAGAAPSKPNGSALNQLRTNENALNFLWELREFKISATTGFLFQDTVKLTPDQSLNNTFIFTNIATGALPMTPFLGGSARAEPAQLNTFFNGPGLANNIRFPVSLDTCTACHIRETSTNGVPAGNNAFLHVDPRTMPARLSRFLTGSTASILDAPDLFNVTDPVVAATIHPFNDLDRRRQVLASLGGSSCFVRFLAPPSALFDVLRPIGPNDVVPRISDLRLNSVNVPILSPH